MRCTAWIGEWPNLKNVAESIGLYGIYQQAYSSDLNRAYQTCCIILSKNETSASSLEVEKLALIRERSFGPWENKLISEYAQAAKEAGVPGYDVSLRC